MISPVKQTKRKRKMSPKSLANLRPAGTWKPGQSGNPAGPPKVKIHLRRHVERFINMTPKKIGALLKDEKAMESLKAVEVIAIKHVWAMMQTNDFNRLKEEFDRDERIGAEDHKDGPTVIIIERDSSGCESRISAESRPENI